MVLATPIIEKLRIFFPDAQIDFLLRKGNEGLLTGHPHIHELLVWDKKKNKRKNLFRMLMRIRKNRYDKIINVQRFFATGLLTVFSGAKQTIGFDKNPLSFLFTKKVRHMVGGEQPMHETARNLQLIRDFTDDSDIRPKLYPSPADYSFVETWASGKFITISPASVWFTKQFPVSKWIPFIDHIPSGYEIYLLGGPGDRALCKNILESCTRGDLHVLAGDLSYLQSAAFMSRAVMNYVNDSAPLHFASAMNAPVTAVYCSTIPEFGFGPVSDVQNIVEVEEKLSCRPCGLHGYSSCPLGHFKCAMDIQEGELLKTVPL